MILKNRSQKRLVLPIDTTQPWGPRYTYLTIQRFYRFGMTSSVTRSKAHYATTDTTTPVRVLMPTPE